MQRKRLLGLYNELRIVLKDLVSWDRKRKKFEEIHE